jgi:hypothetical protein
LTTTVPPRDLARAVTVRALRALHSGARAAQGKLRRAAFEGIGVFPPTPERPPSERAPLRGPRPVLLDTSPAARERTARLLRERWPEECAGILKEAEDAREGKLVIFGKRVDCRKLQGPSSLDAAALDFYRDPVAPEVTYDPRTPGPLVNLFMPGADAKAAWEVGRLAHLWRYGQARWLSTDKEQREVWTRAFLATVRQFRSDCPAGVGVQWSCAMEVAARAMHTALAWAYVEDGPSVSEAIRDEVAAMMSEHGRFIETHLEDTGAVRTNHYAADLVGLVVIGSLFPELPQAGRWRDVRGRDLWEEIARQVRPDGTHFESASGYQRLCVELFLAAVLAARAAGAAVPRETIRQVSSLFRSAGEMLKPSGRMPQLGDLDSGRGLPLLTRPALDCSYLPALGAAALLDGSVKPTEMACPPEVAWLLGEDGVDRFESVQARAFRGSVLLRDAGIAVLRAEAGYLCLTAGPNGQGGCGGHAHNDKNGVEISWGGTDLVVDRGTFVYARDPAERNRRRGTAAHSTVQVDGMEQNRILPGRLFGLRDRTRARILRLERRAGVQLATGEHRGYEHLAQGVLHQRSAMLLAKDRAFAISDEMRGTGAHVFEQRWFVPHEGVRMRAASPAERARLSDLRPHLLSPEPLDAERCFEVTAQGRPAALFAFGASLPFDVALEATDTSPGYGELAPARLIALRCAGEAPASLSCVILVFAGQSGMSAPARPDVLRESEAVPSFAHRA